MMIALATYQCDVDCNRECNKACFKDCMEMSLIYHPHVYDNMITSMMPEDRADYFYGNYPVNY